mmetsp:Transcript_95290/g.255851  ORF Transcript_95290/g.255851 Transcript_95290/m.255851 type:complete len:272 (+) Transcript_95290:294-1109(+)
MLPTVFDTSASFKISCIKAKSTPFASPTASRRPMFAFRVDSVSSISNLSFSSWRISSCSAFSSAAEAASAAGLASHSLRRASSPAASARSAGGAASSPLCRSAWWSCCSSEAILKRSSWCCRSSCSIRVADSLLKLSSSERSPTSSLCSWECAPRAGAASVVAEGLWRSLCCHSESVWHAAGLVSAASSHVSPGGSAHLNPISAFRARISAFAASNSALLLAASSSTVSSSCILRACSSASRSRTLWLAVSSASSALLHSFVTSAMILWRF